jgi:hypothetical protein
MAIVMHSVNSSAVARIGHDPRANLLYVVFAKSRRVWQYFDVDRSEFEALLSAESVGRRFAARIRQVRGGREIGSEADLARAVGGIVSAAEDAPARGLAAIDATLRARPRTGFVF